MLSLATFWGESDPNELHPVCLTQCGCCSFLSCSAFLWPISGRRTGHDLFYLSAQTPGLWLSSPHVQPASGGVGRVRKGKGVPSLFFGTHFSTYIVTLEKSMLGIQRLRRETHFYFLNAENKYQTHRGKVGPPEFSCVLQFLNHTCGKATFGNSNLPSLAQTQGIWFNSTAWLQTLFLTVSISFFV